MEFHRFTYPFPRANFSIFLWTWIVAKRWNRLTFVVYTELKKNANQIIELSYCLLHLGASIQRLQPPKNKFFWSSIKRKLLRDTKVYLVDWISKFAVICNFSICNFSTLEKEHNVEIQYLQLCHDKAISIFGQKISILPKRIPHICFCHF